MNPRIKGKQTIGNLSTNTLENQIVNKGKKMILVKLRDSSMQKCVDQKHFNCQRYQEMFMYQKQLIKLLIKKKYVYKNYTRGFSKK